jgi:hypothetical protein
MAKVQASQLLARGEQDVWLSGNPQVSFYRSNFKRHTPFAASTERFLVPVDGKIILGPKSDLLGYTYLTAHDKTTGTLVSNVSWTSLVSTVELVIGNQSIATHDLTYINTIQSVFEADTYSKRAATPGFQALGFFFDTNPLPIAAIRYADVRINITWVSTSAATQYIYKCWALCIHLGEDERHFFSTQRHQILIPLVQRVQISNEPYFSGPLKYIAAPCTNYVGVYDPIPLGITIFKGTLFGVHNASGTSLYSLFWARGVDTNVYNADGTLFGIVPKTNFADDSIIIKSDKVTGKVQWATRIGGTSYDDSYYLEIDAFENVYVTGAAASNPVIFYSTDSTSVSLASPSAFLVKYDKNGIVQWATRTVGGECRALSTEGSNVYISGYFVSTTVTAYDAPGTTSSIPAINRVTSTDGYIVKYNSSGQAQWMTSISGVAIQGTFHRLTTDSTGVYYIGQYSGPTVIIYDAPGTPSSLPSISVPSGKKTAVLVKYSFSGQASWFTQSVGDLSSLLSGYELYSLSSFKNSIFSIIILSAGGKVSLYDSQNILQSNLTNSDSFSYSCLIRYDQSGNILWSTKYGLGLGFSVYNDTILVQSNTTRTSFYGTDGNVVNKYGDELTGNNIFIARYSLDGKIMNTRKITGNISNYMFKGPGSEQYIAIQPVNSFYRVYDTGSDSKYQTIQTGNLGSVYVKVSGPSI